MVRVEGISFAYDYAGRKILDHVGFSIIPGECIAILGNNGAGKSTLLKCINRIFPPLHGTVLVEGQDVSKLKLKDMARLLAYVPQSNSLSGMTVFDAVLLGRKPYFDWDPGKQDLEIVNTIIRQIGLSSFVSRRLDHLSGGEVQKVLLARALAQQPKFLLLDEPTSNLDPYNQHEVLGLVREIARLQKIAVAVIMHDLNLALRYCDKFLFLKDAGVYSFGKVETVSPETIEAVFNIKVDIIEYQGRRVVIPK